MFPLKDIRAHITTQLDNTIGVLKKQRNESITLSETHKADNGHGAYLEQIEIVNIPVENTWIFDNEFGQRKNPSRVIEKQRGAFMSSGQKVESTIIYHYENRLFLFMVEMKRLLSPTKYRNEIVSKFEQSLSTISIFISAHDEFPKFEEAQILPVGICCYNYYEDKNPNDDRDPKSVGGKFRADYAAGKREMLLKIEPLTLNSMQIPIVLFENPNEPKTTSFQVDFNKIIPRINAL